MSHWTSRLLACCLLAAAVPVAGAAQLNYLSEIDEWRQARQEKLLADDGWFTVAGLFWLEEGTTSFGTDSGNGIVLPAASAPGRAGEFRHGKTGTSVVFAEGVAATVNGTETREAELRPDTSGSASTIAMGRLRMSLIERGGRYGIRLRDLDAPARKEFSGLRYFPVHRAYRITARFVPYEQPKSINIVNVLGQPQAYRSPGYAEFTLQGRKLRLHPVLEHEGAKELFFIFKDATSGRETYGGGRFLYTPMAKNGWLVLDFNKAENPPCAYTPHATCPLPPGENRLPISIQAGELTYGTHEAGDRKSVR